MQYNVEAKSTKIGKNNTIGVYAHILFSTNKILKYL